MGVIDGAEKIFSIPKRIPLAETIADTIARAIANGALKPGERVTETALVKLLGTSRAPIREALKSLHAQGILTPDSSRGFRVAIFDERTVEQVLEVRLSLEAILLRDAIVHWRTHDPAATVLNVSIARMQEAAAANDRASSLEADMAFHRAIAEASQNHIAETLWSAIARNVQIIFSLPRFRAEDLYAVLRHHEAFRDFIRAQIADPINEKALRSEVEHHLLQVYKSRLNQDQ